MALSKGALSSSFLTYSKMLRPKRRQLFYLERKQTQKHQSPSTQLLATKKPCTLSQSRADPPPVDAGLRRDGLTFMEHLLKPGIVLRVNSLTHLLQPCEVLLAMPFYK